MKVNRKQWVDNKQPESWTNKIVSRTLDRLDSSNEKPTRALVRTYIKEVLLIQANHP